MSMWMKLVEGVCLCVMSAEDIRKRTIPLWMLAGCCAALGMYPLWRLARTGGLEVRNVTGALLPGIVLLAVSVLTHKAGYADGIVLLFLGMACGAERIVQVFLCSLLLMSGVSILLFLGKKVQKTTALPFLPFLFAGWLICGLTEGFV